MTRATRNNLGLALLIGALVAVSPFTPNEWGPSVLAGAVVATGVFLWRRGQPSQAGAPSARVAMPSLAVWITAALFVALFAPTVAWLYRSWTTSIWINAHGIFVPFVMGYLGWLALRRDPAAGAEESSAWGFAFLGAGLGLTVLDSAIHTRYLGAAGLVLCLPGLSLLWLGPRRTRALAVPLLVGLFMIPIPNAVATQLYLRSLTTAAVEPLLFLLGYSAFRRGTAMELASGTFVISDACSGFATLYAAIAVAIVLGFYAPSVPRRVTVLVAAVPLALACNAVRVLLLLLLVDRFGSGLLDTPIHEASGLATFWAVLILLFLIADPGRVRRAAA